MGGFKPSRDYSAFLQWAIEMILKAPTMFQTLPGIIPHFYGLTRIFNIAERQFQTLPGIILHFYSIRRCASEPDLGFKPFQGLFCISTKMEAC
jgi:hypothetical protein